MTREVAYVSRNDEWDRYVIHNDRLINYASARNDYTLHRKQKNHATSYNNKKQRGFGKIILRILYA